VLHFSVTNPALLHSLRDFLFYAGMFFMKICSWNINSVRLRINSVLEYLAQTQPDLLALQEIKCQDHEFPYDAFCEVGYPHMHVTGQKGWHGVAFVSRHPIEILPRLDFCRRTESRAQAIKINDTIVWNLYIPAGGDVPDRLENDKFDHKICYYEALIAALKNWDSDKALIVCGDFNIAPGENDVWSHKQMLKVVSHTPLELEVFEQLMRVGQFVDPFRETTPSSEKLFSWWSYRAADYRKSNRGLRLDHILLNPKAAELYPIRSAHIHDEVRSWTQPSDHAPIIAHLE
jgi:exodeoxyribonuclease III